jgi:hypothetical protein
MIEAFKDSVYFCHAEHYGQLLLPMWTHQLEDRPFSLERVLVEELDAAQPLREGACRNLFLVLKVEKVLAQFFLTDLVWGSVIVLG